MLSLLPIRCAVSLASSCGALLLLLILAASGAAQESRWPAEKTIGIFRCHADFQFGRDELLLNQLGDLSRDLTEILGLPASRESVHLFLFHDREAYQNYLKTYFPRIPYRRALFIKSKGPGMVFAAKGDDFEIDVRHEATHALLHTVVNGLPLWLDEGLAEYFEVHKNDRSSNNPHLADLRRLLQTAEPPALPTLEAITDFEQLGRDEYRDSFAWVHFMLHGPREAHEELVNYISELRANQQPEPLSRRLRRRLPDLDRRFADHLLGR
ncbi:DUF1570 domain-containing protein [Anatilimnocola floriformis]|uniref:DUF1570 domain-containing protein n=1 Tax=Anatilimnocola floriformis TaxID=2948575 RepID=UPI0020C24C95|nr:DUF1570 domain-containing protein [Anatilimnocola floriformis]